MQGLPRVLTVEIIINNVIHTPQEGVRLSLLNFPLFLFYKWEVDRNNTININGTL